MVKIKEFKLSEFRSFTEEQTIEFAIPDRASNKCGITYILGENNAGKTTLLEAMQLRPNGPHNMVRNSDLHGDRPVDFRFVDELGQSAQHLIQIRPGAARLKAANDTTGQLTYFAFIPSRRYWSPVINSFGSDLENLRLNDGMNTHLRQNPQQGSGFDIASMFARVEENDELYSRACDDIRSVFPDFCSFKTSQRDQQELYYKDRSGVEHRVDFLGDGVVSVMRIVVFLLAEEDDLNNNEIPLVIDEPELSLHPNAKRRLARLLFNYSRDRQIIICTHSPEMVEWEYIEAGAKINRVTKHGSNSIIHHLKDPSSYKAVFSGKNDWQKPHIFDMAAKEIFFMDNILFLEGQEDMALLKHDGLPSEDINIFGYGVGGFSIFEPCLKMAQDLGVEKAVVLFDYGENESKEKAYLKRIFPNYKILMWKRRDIRDKLDKNGKILKVGYFTSDGKKKPESQLRDYNDVMRKIDKYFH